MITKLLIYLMFLLSSCNFGQLDNSSDPFRTEWYLEVTLLDEFGDKYPCQENYATMELLDSGKVVREITNYRCNNEGAMYMWLDTPAGIYDLAGQYRGRGVFSARTIRVIPEYDQSFIMKLRLITNDE